MRWLRSSDRCALANGAAFLFLEGYGRLFQGLTQRILKAHFIEVKMNLRMPLNFKRAYQIELERYHSAQQAGRRVEAWHFLERAHVIGQYHPVSHTGIHVRMLFFAIRGFDVREILGQMVRVTVGWIGSLLNRIPVGNTGGANVPILASMPIPQDLRELLADADTEHRGLAGLKVK